MLNLPQQTLNKIKNTLLKQQKDVENQIKSIDKEDTVLADSVPEASESGTDSWQAEVHSRLTMLKDDLINLSNKIKNSLNRLKDGKYGVCERCGKEIERERLEAMPTATVCLSCSKKPAKRK